MAMLTELYTEALLIDEGLAAIAWWLIGRRKDGRYAWA